jgi:hypothetical protein
MAQTAAAAPQRKNLRKVDGSSPAALKLASVFTKLGDRDKRRSSRSSANELLEPGRRRVET